MKLQRTMAWFAGLFLFGIGTAFAANQTIVVSGGNAMKFTPSTVTINAGDTVTWTYAGGGLPHDVEADDGSFRCAVTCSGSGGDPTSAAWTTTITFPNAGTFGFFCENHGGPGGIGMSGKVLVNATTPPPPPILIGGYITGSWFDPSQSGHGFEIEVTQNNGMNVFWFVFSPSSQGPSQQVWLTAQGTYDPTSNTATLPAFLVTGTNFPPDFNAADVTVTPWGSITFTFTDCNNGTASWTSTIAGYDSGSLPITRITQIAGSTCPQ